MNPTTNQPNIEQRANPNAPQFNGAPNAGMLGGMAANFAPKNFDPNAPKMPNVAPNLPAAPEIAPMGSPETLAANPETQLGPMQGSGQVATPVLPVAQPPIVVPSTTVQSDDSAKTSSNPAAAADEDLIEKEWVAKTKKVINDTRDNPFAQQKQIAALMRDYVKKRYGREVGKAAED